VKVPIVLRLEGTNVEEGRKIRPEFPGRRNHERSSGTSSRRGKGGSIKWRFWLIKILDSSFKA
jgi:hypothetical protein